MLLERVRAGFRAPLELPPGLDAGAGLHLAEQEAVRSYEARLGSCLWGDWAEAPAQLLRRAHAQGGLPRYLLRLLVHRQDETARLSAKTGSGKARALRAPLAEDAARAWEARLAELDADVGTGLRRSW